MSQFSFEEFSKVLDEHGASEDISREDYGMNYRFFCAINKLFGDAFDCEQLYQIIDFYSDIVDGKIPRLMLPMEQRKVSCLYRLTAEDPVLRRFSAETREIFAFAIVDEFKLVYNPEKNKFYNGIVHLGTLEGIMHRYHTVQEFNPSDFPSLNPDPPVQSENFGYTMENPVCMTSIRRSKEYLARLRAVDGEIVSCERRGSGMGANFHCIDIYEIKVKSGEGKSGVKTYRIYIDCYRQTASETAPEHFKLVSGD